MSSSKRHIILFVFFFLEIPDNWICFLHGFHLFVSFETEEHPVDGDDEHHVPIESIGCLLWHLGYLTILLWFVCSPWAVWGAVTKLFLWYCFVTVARTDPAVGVVSEGLEELLVYGQIFDGNPYLIFSPSFEGDSFPLKCRLREFFQSIGRIFTGLTWLSSPRAARWER